MNEELRFLYEEAILEHNRRPRHYMENPPDSNHHAHGFNPLCNDEITVHLKIEGDVVAEVGFEGAGCAVSMASASMMAEAVKGRTVEEVSQLFERVHGLLVEQGRAEGVGKLKVLAGVREFPMRVKCATLPWHTLKAAMANQTGTVTTEEADPSCPQPEERKVP